MWLSSFSLTSFLLSAIVDAIIRIDAREESVQHLHGERHIGIVVAVVFVVVVIHMEL